MDSSDSSDYSDAEVQSEGPINPYDLSKAIKASTDIADYLSEDARYFFKFSLNGPTPVMFYQYKHPLRLTSNLSLDQMRSSLNAFITRKGKEESRVIFYNTEARRQVQQAANNADVETDYRATIRKQLEMYSMESAASELYNFVLTTEKRVQREISAYRYICSAEEDKKRAAVSQNIARVVSELCYASLLRMNVAPEYLTILLDKFLSDMSVYVANVNDQSVMNYFTLEHAATVPFSRKDLIDNVEEAPPGAEQGAATSGGNNAADQTGIDKTNPNAAAESANPSADKAKETPQTVMAANKRLMYSHHTEYQYFTEYVENMLGTIGGTELLSGISAYYNVLGMHMKVAPGESPAVKDTSGKKDIPPATTKKEQSGGKGKQTEKIEGMPQSPEPTQGESVTNREKTKAIIDACQKYSSYPDLYAPNVSLLYQHAVKQSGRTNQLTNISNIIKDKITATAPLSRRPSTTQLAKTPHGGSPSATKKSPRNTPPSQKRAKPPVPLQNRDVGEGPEIYGSVPSSEEFLSYNELFQTFKHIFHFYQYYHNATRDVRLLRCRAADPLFSLAEYIRMLATNGQNELTRDDIAEAALFTELSTLLADGSLEGVDVFDDLLRPELAGSEQASTTQSKTKSPVDRSKVKVTTPLESLVVQDESRNGAQTILNTLKVKLFSVGDLVNYLRFLAVFLNDSYEVQAREAIVKEVQDMAFLSLCKADNNTAGMRDYLLNRRAMACLSPIRLLSPRWTTSMTSPEIYDRAPPPLTEHSEDNYFSSLISNLNNDTYMKTLIGNLDLIFIAGDPVSGKTLVATELAKRLTEEKKVNTAILDTATVYRSLYEELMRILDQHVSASQQQDSEHNTMYSESELITELLALHTKLLYMQLANAQPGARFYPHPLHSAKSVADSLILNANSFTAGTRGLPCISEVAASASSQAEQQHGPGRSTLRAALPADTDTFSTLRSNGQDMGATANINLDQSAVQQTALLPNMSLGSLLPTTTDTYRDVSLFSQHEGEPTDEQSGDNPQQSVRFHPAPDVQTLLNTPEQYLLFYKALQKKVRQCLLSRTGPNISYAQNNHINKNVDGPSELQEIEQVDPHQDVLANILSGQNGSQQDTLMVDVGDPKQVERVLIRAMVIQAITQGLLSNYKCILFDGFPNSVQDVENIEDLLNGCLSADSLGRMMSGYAAQSKDTSVLNDISSALPEAPTDPLSPVLIRRSGITSIIYLYDDNFEAICQRLYGRIFISSHPVESDDLYNICVDSYNMHQEGGRNSSEALIKNESQLGRTSTCSVCYPADQELSMTDDSANPKKQHIVNEAKVKLLKNQAKDFNSSSDNDFSSSYSMEYSSEDNEDTQDPDCERVRKQFPISPEASEAHDHVKEKRSTESVALTAVRDEKCSKMIYNSHYLDVVLSNYAPYNNGLKVPAHEVHNIGFMHSATLDVLNQEPVKPVVMYGEDYYLMTPNPVEIPLQPVPRRTDLPTRNASKANLSLLSIYTTTSAGFVPWTDEKSAEASPPPNGAFLKSYPIVDPQAYDAFCKAMIRHNLNMTPEADLQVGAGNSKLSVAEIFFSYLFFDLYQPLPSPGDADQKVALHKHEVVRNLIQLNYENRLLVNRVNIELASHKHARNVLHKKLQSLYGSLSPYVLLPLSLRTDELFRTVQQRKAATEYTLTATDLELRTSDKSPPVAEMEPSILYSCNVNAIFTKAVAAFSDNQARGTFDEGLAEISNRIYHHVLRAMECKQKSIAPASYEISASILGHGANNKLNDKLEKDKNPSFATEFLVLYRSELGIEPNAANYLDYPIPEPAPDVADPKKAKAPPAKTSAAAAGKGKGSQQEVTYAAPNLFATFNLPRSFFSDVVPLTLRNIARASEARKALVDASVGRLVVLQTFMAEILTHESVGQLSLLTGFFDTVMTNAHATFTEFVKFYKSINKETRNQQTIKSDSLLLIEKCLLQSNNDIFKTKAHSDALINGLVTRYMRLSAKFSMDVLGLADYRDIAVRYLPQIAKERETGIALGILLIQFITTTYEALWADITYIAFIFFALHELSLSAYASSANVLQDILADLSNTSSIESLAEAYTARLERFLDGKVVTTALVEQQLAQLKAPGKQPSPVLITGTVSLQEHVQQKNQKPYEPYAASLDSLYPFAKSLVESPEAYQTILEKTRVQAGVSASSSTSLTVEEFANNNCQAAQNAINVLNDLAQNGILVSQSSGNTQTRVPLHSAHQMFVARLIDTLGNKLTLVKWQVATHMQMCADGLSEILLNVEKMIDDLYAKSLSLSTSAARTMQTVIDKEIDIKSFTIDTATRCIKIEVMESDEQ